MSRVLTLNRKSDNALIYKGDFAFGVSTTFYTFRFVSNKPLIYKDKPAATLAMCEIRILKLIIGKLEFKVLTLISN
jgi:hypothetical protein